MENCNLFYSPLDDEVYIFLYDGGGAGDPTVSGNVNVTDDGLCFGQIKTDPDIAGWGVFLSLVFNTVFIFVVFMARYWVHYIKRLWNNNIIKAEPEDQELTSAESLVWTLGDTCLVSGLAITISSLVKINDDSQYPLYHIFIARSYAELATLGHSIGRMFVYDKLVLLKPWTVYTRTCLSATFVVLYLVWGGVALERFRVWDLYKWPGFTPFCFSYRLNQVPGSFVFWIQLNLYWMPTSFLDLFLRGFTAALDQVSLTDIEFTKTLDDFLEQFDVFIIQSAKHVITEMLILKGNIRHIFTARWQSWLFVFSRFLLVLVKAVFVLVLFLGCVIILPSTALAPLSCLFFMAWSIFDVISIKVSNEAVMSDVLAPQLETISNSESTWGFGQIFPVVMAGTFLLSMIDAVFEYYWTKRRVANGPINIELDLLL